MKRGLLGTILTLLSASQAFCFEGFRGIVALDQSIRDIESGLTTLVFATHPGDENLAELIHIRRSTGARVVVVLANWGESREGLTPYPTGERAVCRSEAMERALEGFGIELRCLNFLDFGVAVAVDEALRKWNEASAREDVARTFREIRPDRVRFGGCQSLQSEAFLKIIKEAAKLSADPTFECPFPPLAEAPDSIDVSSPISFASELPVDPLIGTPFLEIGKESRLPYAVNEARPGASLRALSLARRDARFFDPLLRIEDPDVSALKEEWTRSVDELKETSLVDRKGILNGLIRLAETVQKMNERLSASPESAEKFPATLSSLKRKERQIHEAVATAAGFRVELSAPNPIPAGEEFEVSARSFPGPEIDDVHLQLFLPTGFIPLGAESRDSELCKFFTVRASTSEVFLKPKRSRLYWQEGPIPPLFTVKATLTVSGADRPIVVERRLHGTLTHPIDLEIVPELPIVRLNGEPLQIWLKLANHTDAPQTGIPVLRPPMNWAILRQDYPRLELAPMDVEFVSYLVMPESDRSKSAAIEGDFLYGLPAQSSLLNATTSVELRKVHLSRRIHLVKAECPKDLKVGWIGTGSKEIETAVAALRVDSREIDPSVFDRTDLSSFATVLLDRRAFHEHPELRRGRRKLLRYVLDGGNLVVLGGRFSEGEQDLLPYRLRTDDSVLADEAAPVAIIDASHPLLRRPNVLTNPDFLGWSKERGRDFAVVWGPEYEPLLSVKGADGEDLSGGLLVAEYGRGSLIYSGFAWEEQLRLGHEGAFKAFANMLSYRTSTEEPVEEKRPNPKRR